MKFELQRSQLDFGETPVENMFINTLMANANESQIKVYLYALSLAHSGVEDVSNENIAKEMNLTQGQVLDAWDFWIDKGIVEKSGDTYLFKSMRLQLLMPNLDSGGLETNIGHTSNDQEDQVDLATVEMINSIEKFISQSSQVEIKLNAREIKKIMELMNEFQVRPEFLSYAYMIASNVRGTKSVDPLVATIRNWMFDGVTDMEKLDSYLEEKNKAKEEKKTSQTSKKFSKQDLSSKDTRTSKEERRAFVEAKLNKKIPINKKDKK